MPATDSPGVIVARFLKSNHYNQTLDAFLSEAGLSEEASTTNPGDWTIEKILEEKKQFDTSLAFEKKANDGNQGWSLPAPTKSTTANLPNSANVLFVMALSGRNKILSTLADKSLNQSLGRSPYTFHQSDVGNDSPILSVKQLGERHLLTTSMSGQLALRDATSGKLLSKRRDHLKMAVQVAVAEEGPNWMLATAGWDQNIMFYRVSKSQLSASETETDLAVDENDILGEPFHALQLQTVPESLLFVRHPDTNVLHLILSRRDSSFLYYYTMTHDTPEQYAVAVSGRQNLAPHSNAWVAFTPSWLSPCPSDPTLLAIATSHLPHMKLILVRLLFPAQTSLSNGQNQTPASMARANLATQDREEAAIRLQVTTLAPQTPYSNPQVVWRPNATGVWVNGDDGVIRGLEVKTGKIVSVLKGHDPASKVRSLWAGYLRDQNGNTRERLVSGGFDKQVLVWDCA